MRIALPAPQGLLTPIVKEANVKSLSEISTEVGSRALKPPRIGPPSQVVTQAGVREATCS